jgi:three-Cys-motif partner protein
MTSDDEPNNKHAIELHIKPLFPDLAATVRRKIRRYKRVPRAICTEHKAKFIEQYLRIFVQITKHGTYIDGFAGPQYFDRLDSWAAALVLKSEPKWLRHFFLCELSRKGIKALNKLVQEQPTPRDRRGRKLSRNIEVWPGDFNANIDKILRSGKITQKEAAFCLLDQRTFECHWETVKKLARYKKPAHNKIEILYFLGVGWLHRAFSGVHRKTTLEKWWGRDDYGRLTSMSSWEIAELVRKRFAEELGYAYVAAYPIFDRDRGNKVMYYMIHASDHDEAPALMVRAHHKAVRGLPKEVQLPLISDASSPMVESNRTSVAPFGRSNC